MWRRGVSGDIEERGGGGILDLVERSEMRSQEPRKEASILTIHICLLLMAVTSDTREAMNHTQARPPMSRRVNMSPRWFSPLPQITCVGP
jgi:hypothetical protein